MTDQEPVPFDTRLREWYIVLYSPEEEPVAFYRREHPKAHYIQTWVQGLFCVTYDEEMHQGTYWNQDAEKLGLPVNPYMKDHRGTVVMITQL